MKAALLPYQARWAAEDAPLAAYRKSRRIGISYATAYVAVRHAGMDAAGDVWYQTYSLESAKEFILDAAGWAQRLDRALEEIGESLLDDEGEGGEPIQTHRIVFPNGRRVTAMVGTPRVWRSKGRPGDLGIIDEAAFVDDLGSLMKSALAFLMWGGRLRVISSPHLLDDPFETLCADLRAARRPGAIHETYFDDALDEGFYELVRRRGKLPDEVRTRADYRAWVVESYGEYAGQELFGEALVAARRWLSDEEIRGCEHEGAQIPALYAGGPWALGIDIARRRDLWVATVVENVAEVLWVREMQEEHNLPFWKRPESGHDSQEIRVERLIDDYGRHRLLKIGPDQTGMGESVVEGYQNRWGDAVEGVLLTEGRRLDLAANLREAFRSRRVRIPPRPELRRDLRSMGDKGTREAPRLVYVGDEAGKKVKGEHADRFWALAIAVEMAGREPAEVGGDTVGAGWGGGYRAMAPGGGAHAVL